MTDYYCGTCAHKCGEEEDGRLEDICVVCGVDNWVERGDLSNTELHDYVWRAFTNVCKMVEETRNSLTKYPKKKTEVAHTHPYDDHSHRHPHVEYLHRHPYDHDHDHHDHNHKPTTEEVTVINKFLELSSYFDCISVRETLKKYFVTTFIRKISSPVDLYEHNFQIKKLLNQLEIYLCYGRKVNVSLRHAYTQHYSELDCSVYTIQTNVDFGVLDPNYQWASYDLITQ